MEELNLSHNVFFTLKDASETAVEALIEDCHKYIKDNPGIIYFCVGSIVPEHKRDVNIRDFQVGLHVVFSSKFYHDQFQVSEKHGLFVERGKNNWEKIRVFDTYVK